MTRPLEWYPRYQVFNLDTSTGNEKLYSTCRNLLFAEEFSEILNVIPDRLLHYKCMVDEKNNIAFEDIILN